MESCELNGHQWSKAIETCRQCGGTDIEEVALEAEPSGAFSLRARAEPMYAMLCAACDDYTMVSPALHCERCGEIEWVKSMDEEIFGA